jgi:hypothetical protein
MNQFRTDHRKMLTCQVEPMQDGVGRMALETLQCPQAIALTQRSQHIDKLLVLISQGLKKRAFVRAERVEAGRAIQALFHVTVNSDIVCSHSARVPTCGLITPMLFEFHDVSPPCAIDDTSIGSLDWSKPSTFVHGLGIQPPIFTA